MSKRLTIALLLLGGCAHAPTPPSAASDQDPYLWLEEVEGARALGWVRKQNQQTRARLQAHPDYASLLADARAALDAPSRVPHVTARKGWLYNFWRDAKHERGVYRRVRAESLSEASPPWETVLDLDALSAKEKKQWVFKRMSCLPPAHQKCLVELSLGGGDAVEIREFDSATLKFVEGGFFLPSAKQTVGWVHQDALYVASDFGPDSLTESGYPRVVKLWKRGTPLAEAKTLHQGAKTSVGVNARRYRTDDGNLDVLQEWLSFWESTYFLITEEGLKPLALPKRVQILGAFRGRLIVSLKEDWTVEGTKHPSGSIVTLRPGQAPEPLAQPTKEEIIVSARDTKQGILVESLQNVRGRVSRFTLTDAGWKRTVVPFPDNGAVQIETVDDDTGDFFVAYESFTTPPTLYRVPADSLEPSVLARQAAAFDAEKFEVEQHWAQSKDGTRVPYFMVKAKDLELDGTNPTHIFSYGGFRVPLTPAYSGSYEQLFGAYGKLWLERGGVFVLANIRGGGEFGPAWHEAALLENRTKAFEDFEAVAEDLISRKVTAPKHLGIEGRSNGGLLVAATLHRRPELYGAVVCGVPLTDMRRYHRMLAGASWMAEFGDPDKPEDWAFIKAYSPYHNLERAQPYPAVFFYTSTKDDRVHPAHARKMAARMIELGYEVWYYENLEGGHGGSSTNDQLALRLALAYAHLWSQLR